MPAKLKPGVAETVLAIPACEIDGEVYVLSPTGGATALTSITAAVLNEYASVTTLGANGARGGNITCAIHDDMTLGLTGAETDPTRTLCTVGDSVSIKRLNFEASIAYDRDASLTSTTSDLNLVHALFRAPDVLYVLAHRIGYASTEAFANGQKVSYYYVATDIPVPVMDDDEYIGEMQAFTSKGVVTWEDAV